MEKDLNKKIYIFLSHVCLSILNNCLQSSNRFLYTALLRQLSDTLHKMYKLSCTGLASLKSIEGMYFQTSKYGHKIDPGKGVDIMERDSSVVNAPRTLRC